MSEMKSLGSDCIQILRKSICLVQLESGVRGVGFLCNFNLSTNSLLRINFLQPPDDQVTRLRHGKEKMQEVFGLFTSNSLINAYYLHQKGRFLLFFAHCSHSKVHFTEYTIYPMQYSFSSPLFDSTFIQLSDNDSKMLRGNGYNFLKIAYSNELTEIASLQEPGSGKSALSYHSIIEQWGIDFKYDSVISGKIYMEIQAGTHLICTEGNNTGCVIGMHKRRAYETKSLKPFEVGINMKYVIEGIERDQENLSYTEGSVIQIPVINTPITDEFLAKLKPLKIRGVTQKESIYVKKCGFSQLEDSLFVRPQTLKATELWIYRSPVYWYWSPPIENGIFHWHRISNEDAVSVVGGKFDDEIPDDLCTKIIKSFQQS